MAAPSTPNPRTGPRTPGRQARQHLLEKASVRKARPIHAAVVTLVACVLACVLPLSPLAAQDFGSLAARLAGPQWRDAKAMLRARPDVAGTVRGLVGLFDAALKARRCELASRILDCAAVVEGGELALVGALVAPTTGDEDCEALVTAEPWQVSGALSRTKEGLDRAQLESAVGRLELCLLGHGLHDDAKSTPVFAALHELKLHSIARFGEGEEAAFAQLRDSAMADGALAAVARIVAERNPRWSRLAREVATDAKWTEGARLRAVEAFVAAVESGETGDLVDRLSETSRADLERLALVTFYEPDREVAELGLVVRLADAEPLVRQGAAQQLVARAARSSTDAARLALRAWPAKPGEAKALVDFVQGLPVAVRSAMGDAVQQAAQRMPEDVKGRLLALGK